MRRVLTALSFAVASVAAPSAARAQEAVADPWEGFNRDFFATHEALDQAVVEPIARGYRTLTPAPLRRGVLNFLRNLRSPAIFANDMLQGEIERAGITAARFGVNTTVGLAGVLDPAASLGLERHDEDFGQTLAVWGVGAGPYIFVPLLGPTNVRDGAGRIVDIALDPLTWATFDSVDQVRAGRTIGTGIVARENVLETVDDVRRDALDPYVSIRTSYGLLRNSAIKNGPDEVQDLPEFEDISNGSATSAPAAAEESPTDAIQSLAPDVSLAPPSPQIAKGDLP